MHQLLVGISGIIAFLGLLAAPASAQPTQEGLVNVNITDVTVQIPIGVAANICDVNVSVLVGELLEGPTLCRTGSIALAEEADGGGAPPQQEGLVNVNITDVVVQAPIAVAANVCGVDVNVLVSELDEGPVYCFAEGEPTAVVSR